MQQRLSERGFLGMSHSPLYGLNAVDGAVLQTLDAAVALAREAVQRFDPQLVVLVGPDHYNGFFNELMPPFCIGSEATSVGDYLTPAGPLNVDAALALGLAEHLMDADFDIAVSRRMKVDHGFVQALQFLWGGLDSPPVVPIFLNAVAQPGIPRLRRCEQLGRAIGAFLDQLPQRTLVIGSGGLSHEPPVPTLAHPDPAVRERIICKRTPTEQDVAAKTARVMAAGVALASGTSAMKPLNPRWDAQWMQACEQADWRDFCAQGEAAIEQQAGLSAHESKSWVVARSALESPASGGALQRALHHYQAIPEFIAGYGILMLHNLPATLSHS